MQVALIILWQILDYVAFTFYWRLDFLMAYGLMFLWFTVLLWIFYFGIVYVYVNYYEREHSELAQSEGKMKYHRSHHGWQNKKEILCFFGELQVSLIVIFLFQFFRLSHFSREDDIYINMASMVGVAVVGIAYFFWNPINKKYHRGGNYYAEEIVKDIINA